MRRLLGENRPMNVAVCVKQIPDQALPLALDSGDHRLVREGKLIMDDSDSYGVEMGLQLVEAAGGGEVCLVSMAPNSETSGLRNALAIGAARAVLVSDPLLAGSDALGTAKVLAAAATRASTSGSRKASPNLITRPFFRPLTPWSSPTV